MKYFLIMMLLPITTFSQSWKEQYYEASEANNDSLATAILTEWIKAEPSNPDMTVAAFNYFVLLGREEVLLFNYSEPPPQKPEDMLLVQDDSGKTVSYISSDYKYDQANFDYAMELIADGIKRNPDRLDLRFGKAYILGETRNYKEHIQDIKDVLERNIENEEAWLWMENEPLSDVPNFLTESLHDYVSNLFYAGEDYLHDAIEIAELILKQYPNSVIHRSNIGAAYYSLGDYQKAIENFKMATEVDPEDVVVLLNLAVINAELENWDEAIIYYEKVLICGEAYDQEFAREQLELIRDKK